MTTVQVTFDKGTEDEITYKGLRDNEWVDMETFFQWVLMQHYGSAQ